MTAMKLFQTFTTAAVKVSTATCNIICEDDFACNSSDFGDNLQSGLEFDIDRMSIQKYFVDLIRRMLKPLYGYFCPKNWIAALEHSASMVAFPPIFLGESFCLH